MSVPRFAGKHEADVIVTPEAVLQHRRDRGQPVSEQIPEAIILTYQPQLLEAITSFEETTPLTIGGPAEVVHALDRTERDVGIVGAFGIGAPVATAVLEELIALGARRFVSIGAAGSLQPHLSVGDLVVCTSAVRDEGVSHHYAPADHTATPDHTLTAAIGDRARARGLTPHAGATWTIDAIFRETVAEALHYTDQGVLTVEMEAAALFTVARHRSVALASAVCVSDSLANGEWEPSYGSDVLAANIWALFQIAVDTLQET